MRIEIITKPVELTRQTDSKRAAKGVDICYKGAPDNQTNSRSLNLRASVYLNFFAPLAPVL